VRSLTILCALASAAIAGPSERSKPSGDLQLIGTVEPKFILKLELHNVGKNPITVYSHVNVNAGRDYDWFGVELEWPVLDGKACTGRKHLTLSLSDTIGNERDKSVFVNQTIAPGGSLVHEFDVPALAGRKSNGSTALGGSLYRIVTRYHVDAAEPGVWTGRLDTPPLRVHALDQQRVDACEPAHPDTW
jgi:hypothetical protein